jgi:hypothetical protein
VLSSTVRFLNYFRFFNIYSHEFICFIKGWHSGKELDIRNGTVPECWNGWLDVKANKCKPFPEPKKKTDEVIKV